jgi:chaperone required for assembly of F1-ATPase
MECKSIVLALAFMSNFLSLEQVKIASRIEEEFQVEIWGVVEGGHDMDRLNNSVSLSAVSLFNNLFNGSQGILPLLKPSENSNGNSYSK